MGDHECNWHTLQRMSEKAQKRGEAVVLARQDDGWWAARYTDHEKPSAYFMELTDHCVC